MYGEAYVTLRSDTDQSMYALVAFIQDNLSQLSAKHQLTHSIDFEDIFAATVNSPDAVSIIKAALPNKETCTIDTPFRWSEDFGLFTQKYSGAMFGLGAGELTPALHNEKYDFPDEVIAKGSNYFISIARHIFSSATVL